MTKQDFLSAESPAGVWKLSGPEESAASITIYP